MDPLAPQPQMTPISKQTILQPREIQVGDGPDGSRQITAILANGEVFSIPLTPENAKTLGQRLISPKVEIPGMASLNGEGAPN